MALAEALTQTLVFAFKLWASAAALIGVAAIILAVWAEYEHRHGMLVDRRADWRTPDRNWQ